MPGDGQSETAWEEENWRVRNRSEATGVDQSKWAETAGPGKSK
jgi:hypothetical protein